MKTTQKKIPPKKNRLSPSDAKAILAAAQAVREAKTNMRNVTHALTDFRMEVYKAAQIHNERMLALNAAASDAEAAVRISWDKLREAVTGQVRVP
jgi:hypothetical protein